MQCRGITIDPTGFSWECERISLIHGNRKMNVNDRVGKGGNKNASSFENSHLIGYVK